MATTALSCHILLSDLFGFTDETIKERMPPVRLRSCAIVLFGRARAELFGWRGRSKGEIILGGGTDTKEDGFSFCRHFYCFLNIWIAVHGIHFGQIRWCQLTPSLKHFVALLLDDISMPEQNGISDGRGQVRSTARTSEKDLQLVAAVARLLVGIFRARDVALCTVEAEVEVTLGSGALSRMSYVSG